MDKRGASMSDTVKKEVTKKKTKKPKQAKELTCLTCIQRNRVPNIVDGVCLTCKQGNRLQEVVEV